MTDVFSVSTKRVTKLESSIWRWVPLLVLVGILLITLLPARDLGFTSDDYEHLVEATAKLPLTASFDELHRPLRNIVFKASYLYFGLNSAPYHLTLILLHLAAVTALYCFMLRLTASHWAAMIAATFFGFFPRNHQIIFWVAAGQDSVVTICALVACGAFISFKSTQRVRYYFVSLVAFASALGFKETAIAILPLLILVDLSCGDSPMITSPGRSWKVYLPLITLEGAAALWMRGFFEPHHRPHPFYGPHSLAQTLKMGAKFALNTLLPFSSPLEVKQVMQDPLLLLIVFVLALMLVTGSILWVHPRKLFLAAGWWATAAVPTAVLGIYTDRFLGFPCIGLSILLGLVSQGGLLRTKRRMPLRFFIVIIVTLYAILSIHRITFYERLWREAAREIQRTMAEARHLAPAVPPGSVLYFVNLTHSMADGQVYVFNTGFNGILLAWGYDQSIVGHRICKSTDPHEKALVRQLLDCVPEQAAFDNHFIFLSQERLISLSGNCVGEAVASSYEKDFDLWR